MTEENRRWWNNKELRSSLPAIVLILAFFSLVLFYKHGRDNISPKDAYALNLHTEGFGVALGVIITVFVIDALNRRRDADRRKQDLIDRLLREVLSPRPEIAQAAFDELRKRRLIFGEDSVLQNANLVDAKPVKADLRWANLSGAIFLGADFSDSDFQQANLDNTVLCSAKVTHACFWKASLRNADLEGSTLTEADLDGVDLSGANLKNAKIEPLFTNTFQHVPEAKLEDNGFMEIVDKITLPDSNQVISVTDAEISRFTNPDHPNFWRSCNPQSPAHPDYNRTRKVVLTLKRNRR